jgi:ABC-type bacteriocin/lantibiotic exporter with double-glycine peptidase domain
VRRHQLTAAILVIGLVAGSLAWLAKDRDGLDGVLVAREGVTLQAGPSDCGLAALANLAVRLGRETPPYDELLARHPAPKGGFALSNLQAVSAELGIGLTPWQVEAASLATIPLPAILHLSEGHFVVLVGRESRDWDVVDPQLGLLRVRPARLRQAFSGAALLLRERAG